MVKTWLANNSKQSHFSLVKLVYHKSIWIKQE